MPEESFTKQEEVRIEDLQTEFLSLKVGEEIPRLRVQRIRKVINKTRDDNLSGVDYKYIIESGDGKLLSVNAWTLWKKIAVALRNAGKIEVDLHLSHPRAQEYVVRLVD